MRRTGLVAGRELVPAEEVVAPPVPEEPVAYIVLHIKGKKLDLVLKKLHNCGRYDTVES